MWEAISATFNALPLAYRMTMLPILIVIGLWVLVHMRRDKQGKLYFHSQIYEQKKHTTKLDEVVHNIKDITLDVLKLTFYNERLPASERMYAGLRYLARGGNGDVKKDVMAFREGRADLYNALVLVHPELAIKDEGVAA